MRITYRSVGMSEETCAARKEILAAALKLFAQRGYAGASVQDIISQTQFSKPTLYYYFKNKAGLYQALLEDAYDACHEVIRESQKGAVTFEEQLDRAVTALFEFLSDKQNLTRVVFASAFAAPGELPPGVPDQKRRRRNFEFFHDLIKRGVAEGFLDSSVESIELARGIFGAINYHIMVNTLQADIRLDRQTAQRVVRLFLGGAAARNPIPA